MKKKYNMSVPGQDEELWAASYMTLFHVNRKEVPSPCRSQSRDLHALYLQDLQS